MQVKESDDTLDFMHKFRNYSKEDGHQYRNLKNNRFVLRRKNKIYCPNCKNQTTINDIYCKECGTCLESISKKTYDFNIKNILSGINIKDSLKVSGFTIIILFFISMVLKQILGGILGEYSSYIGTIDILLLLNGGNLSIFTSAINMLSYGSYYNLSFQVCALIFLILPVLCFIISYKFFLNEKNTNELTLIRQSIGVGISYGLILAILAIISRNQLSIGDGYLSAGYNLIYSVSFLSVLFRGILLGFLSILYIGIKKEYENSNIYLGIFKQAIKTIALGYVIVFVLLTLGYLIGLSYVYEFGISNIISNVNIFIIISQLAAYILGFVNLSFVTIGNQNLVLTNLFETSLSIDFKLCLIAFVALSALILFISGIKLNRKYKTDDKKIVFIFSIFYASIMGILALFTYININGGSLLGYSITMNMNVIITLVTSFIYSFIITFVGFKLSNWD